MASREMRLKILACRQVYSARNQLGHPYSIFEVEAAKPDGGAIKERLRSFTALPVGREVVVVVVAHESERYGRSFVLHAKAESRMAEVAELVQRVEVLTARVAQLEAGLGVVAA